MSTPTISVAMPTYNGARYLPEQLASLAAQTTLPVELVVSDDASRDDTVGVVEHFAETSPFPVRVFRNDKGLGCNGNFAAAIARCGGDVIALCDQDDVWLPQHLERLLAPMAADPAIGLVISNSTYVDADLKPTGTDLWHAADFTAADVQRIARGPQFRQWVRHHVAAGHALAFRSDLRDVLLPFYKEWMYDRWLSVVCAACTKIVMLDEKLTLHRHHAAQAVGHDKMSLSQRSSQQATVTTDYFDGQIDALAAVRDRLAAHAGRVVDAEARRVLDGRIGLFRARRDMRTGGVARRVVGAVRALGGGLYHRHGRGWLTFARDVRG